MEEVKDKKIRFYCLKKIIEYVEEDFQYYVEKYKNGEMKNSKNDDGQGNPTKKDIGELLQHYAYVEQELDSENPETLEEYAEYTLDRLFKILIQFGHLVISAQSGNGIQYIISGSDAKLYR